MRPFLESARYIDSAHPAVAAFAAAHVQGGDDRTRAVAPYYAVRDEIRYNLFLDFSDDAVFRGSACLEAGQGFCVGKAAGDTFGEDTG